MPLGKVRLRHILLCLSFLLIFSGVEPHRIQAGEPTISLSEAEIQWLARHPALRLGVGVAFPPFMWMDKQDGQYVFKGMVSDYVELLGQRLGVEMQVVSGIPFTEALARSRRGEIDVLPCLSNTPERAEYLNFTPPFLNYPVVIITREDAPLIGGLSDLSGKRLAIVKHLVVYSKLRNDYPDLDLDYVFTNKVEENLDAVSIGRADACLINLAVASYYIHRKGLTNLRIAAPVNWQGVQLSVGVRKDWPVLQAIMAKALASISQEEKDRISQRWIRFDYDLGVNKALVWRWSLGLGLGIALVIGFVLVWNRRMRREVLGRRRAERAMELRAGQQAAISELGRQALAGGEISVLMDRAVSLVRQTLEVDCTGVFELLSENESLRLIAGLGWDEGRVGEARVGSGNQSQGGYALEVESPVVVEDINRETRLSIPSLLSDHGLVSGVSVVIGDRSRPHGVLEAHCRAKRVFSASDVNFMTSVAHVLAAAISRNETKNQIDSLNRLKRDVLLASGFSDRLQLITDGVVDIFQADLARVWMIDRGDRCDRGCSHDRVTAGPRACRRRDRCLHLYASSGRYTHTDGNHGRVPFGVYKIGRIASGEQPRFLTNDVVNDPRIHDRQWAGRLGLVSFVGYRLLSGDNRPLGVLALFSKRPITIDEDRLLEDVANTAAQIIQLSQADRALRESESGLRQAQQIARLGNWTWNLESNEITWSDEMYRLYGIEDRPKMSPADINGQTVTEDLARLDSTIERWKKGDVAGGVEYRIERPDGIIRHMAGSARPIVDDEGRVVRLIGTMQDITERKQAEKTLRRISAAVESTSDAIGMSDADGNHYYQNGSFTRLFGGSAKEIQSAPGGPKSLYADPEVARKVFNEILNGRQWWGETEMVSLTGRVFPCLLKADAIKDEQGNILGAIGFHTDITLVKQSEAERKKLEAQLRQTHKMEAVGTLAGGIAHDFNNILAAIIGYSDLALDDLTDGMPARDNVEQIHRSALRARELVRQILSFSRQNSKQIKELDLEPIIAETLKMLRATVPSTIDIELEADGNLDRVKADPTQIHQLILNLGGNAADAMKEDGGTLTLKLENVRVTKSRTVGHFDLSAGRYVRLMVRDTGPGIDPRLVDRIFDPFFTTKEVGSGTGMGLSVVHGIVQSHKGAIVVDGGSGTGTVFAVYLPSIGGHRDKPDYRTEDVPPSGMGRVLFVDDEQVLVEFADRMLTRLGYTPTVTTSSLRALQIFRAAPQAFDLLITDMTMPGLTGSGLAEAVLRIRPDLPVILCTGYSEQIDEAGARRIGISRLVLKPLSMSETGRIIGEVLGKHHTG